jgi:hypothetical protein
MNRFQKFRKSYGKFSHAAASLHVAMDTAKTNAPINEHEGNFKQARLERASVESYKVALKRLKGGERSEVDLRPKRPRPMKMGFKKRNS